MKTADALMAIYYVVLSACWCSRSAISPAGARQEEVIMAHDQRQAISGLSAIAPEANLSGVESQRGEPQGGKTHKDAPQL
jgi:hypothetical protein